MIGTRALAANNLRSDIGRFLRHGQSFGGVALVGSRRRIFKLILSYSSLPPGSACPASGFVGAMEVKPDRAPTLGVAGAIGLAELLVDDKLPTFLDWKRVVLLFAGECGFLLQPCHILLRGDGRLLIRRLVVGTGRILHVTGVVVDPVAQRPLVSGWFCVPHKEATDRLINGKRPQNVPERHLARMYSPSGLTPLLHVFDEG